MSTKSILAALAMLLLAGNAMAEDSEPGTAELQKCKICHALAQQGGNHVGPDLFHIFGHKAGSAAGFKYSDAMKDSGIVWDDETLAKFLRDPKNSMPGNRMSFPGIKDDAVLHDLVAQLKQATQ